MNEITRLNFENFLWFLFIIASLLDIFGNNKEKESIYYNDNHFKEEGDKYFKIALTIALLIYLYFFLRNYNSLQKADEKKKRLYEIKLLGSSFLIAGVICLIYFQYNNPEFIGSPAI